MAINVLLVDDSKIVRSVLVKTLKLAQIDIGSIFEAADGVEGLAILGQEKIDFVLADINMPNMNGIEMIEKMKKSLKFRDVPVAVISTEGNKQRIDRLKELGIVDFIRKPFTPEQVTHLIKSKLV